MSIPTIEIKLTSFELKAGKRKFTHEWKCKNVTRREPKALGGGWFDMGPDMEMTRGKRIKKK